MIKKLKITTAEAVEIEKLKTELLQHKIKFYQFKNFCKTCDDALIVADALLNNDYKTFKNYKLKYTTHTAQKMKGIQSLSTYKKTSSICAYLSRCGGICAKCYAEKSLKLYEGSLKPTLIYNTLLLKYIDIDLKQIPYINDKYFRFESFSDIQGSQHLKNLIQICKKNKDTIFTLWTKAGATFSKMLKEIEINLLPNNINIVFSAFNINEKVDPQYLNVLQANAQSKNKIKYFIVYDSEEKRKESKYFLCKNKCIDCLKCYKKSKDNIIIAEALH